MKSIDKGQLLFLLMASLPVAWLIASVAVYPLNGVGLIPLLKTWRFGMLWQVLTDSHVRHDIWFNGIKSLGVGLCGSGLLITGLIVSTGRQSKIPLFGDARFATDADIRQSKQVSWGNEKKGGVIIGRYKGKLLRYTQPDFVSMGAGTRAGKGAGIVIPNLLDFEDSMVVLDPKQECYNITSGYRQKTLGQKVFLLDPFSSKTHGFNPLFYVDLDGEKGAGYLLNLSTTLWPVAGLAGAEAHFNSGAGRVFIAFTELLHFAMKYDRKYLETAGVKPLFSIGTVLDLYYNINQQDLLKNRDEWIDKAQNDNDRYLITDALNKIKKLAESEGEAKSSLEETFQKKLNLFTLPLFRKATDRNDCDLRRLRKEKMTVYLGISADDAKIADEFLNLFFNFAIDVNMRENPDFAPENKHNVLFLLDEFPAIGAMHYIKKASGFIAGFKLKLMTIYQNLSQLIEIYGVYGAKTLMSMHPCRVIYAVSEKDDADEVSAKLGYTTLKAKGKSKSRNKTGTSQGESESDAQRALVLPQELGTLKFEEQFVILKGEHPIKCHKAFYFNDDFFMDKLIDLSPYLQDVKSNLKKGQFPSKLDLAHSLLRRELEAINFDLVDSDNLTH
ncbi:MAG: conjugal transfer protein TraG [Candidatus Symbiopectobacterium sp. Dall1.0]|nr:conjugal transfer protein TraG [Candidatus Symbiopectobacterium sp. Dall1.0]